MIVLLALTILTTVSTAEPASDTWLQIQVDQVLRSAGQPEGVIEAHWSSNDALRLQQRGPVISIPPALLATGASPDIMRGVLAMMIAYQQRDVPIKRGSNIAELATVAALTAATGGASTDEASTKLLPLIPQDAIGLQDDPNAIRRQAAWRGARWNEAAGGCTGKLVAFLRKLSEGTIPPAFFGRQAARRILSDMGSLAYPSADACVPIVSAVSVGQAR